MTELKVGASVTLVFCKPLKGKSYVLQGRLEQNFHNTAAVRLDTGPLLTFRNGRQYLADGQLGGWEIDGMVHP